MIEYGLHKEVKPVELLWEHHHRQLLQGIKEDLQTHQAYVPVSCHLSIEQLQLHFLYA